MKFHPLAAMFALFATIALAGCASHRVPDAQRLASVLAHAGEPVNRIRNIKAMGWELVDDEHVLLSMRPRETWLIRVSGPCLDWSGGTTVIGLDSRGPYLMAKLDRIVVSGSPISCRIEEIRPVDTRAMRAAAAAARAQAAGGG